MKSFFLWVFFSPAIYSATLSHLSGLEVVTQKMFTHEWKDSSSGTVIIFLSATCPCSNKHVKYLKELKAKWPQFKFIGVHSNPDENQSLTKSYFEKKKLNFEIIEDSKTKIADALKAYRTPHSFILSRAGKILYEGGVTDSSNPKNASTFYLEDALFALNQGKEISEKKTRVLGCPIDRE